MKILSKNLKIAPAAMVLVLLLICPAWATVSGPCSNCHIMHNSQGNSMVDVDGPNEQLLNTDCVGCHSSTSGGTAISSIGAPIVYNTSAPTYGNKYKTGPNQGLAGGNFYFVEHVNDNRGHNVMLGNSDDVLSTAPTYYTMACGPGSCHENLDLVYTGGAKPDYQGRQGCTKCHMLKTGTQSTVWANSWHHIPQNPGAGKERYAGKYYDAAQGGWVMNWHRHLAAAHTSNRAVGVIAMEDPDWELTVAANDHNDYREVESPNPGRPLTSYSISGFCSGCHMYFSANAPDTEYHKHPAFGVFIPDTGEYADAFGPSHTYDPLVPVGQSNISSLQPPKETVTLGEDKVMCLSCHRAHGSPYKDMLRWDYDEMLVGGGDGDGEGCFKCHTQKDGI